MKTIVSKEIFVIGVSHHNTLSILRSLGEKRLMVILIVISKENRPYVTYSKYIKKYVVIDNELKIMNAMKALHKSQNKAVVIACSDSISSYLDRNYNELSKDFIIPGAKKQGRITELMNKDVMSQLAVKSGLRVPFSWKKIVNNCDISDIDYPCIIKPLLSKDGVKADIAICNTQSELVRCLSHCHCDRIQIQKFINKDVEYQLIGCSLNGGEQVIIPGVSIILRQPDNTNTGFLKYLPIQRFQYEEDACKDFIKRTGYSGLFSLEFLRGKDGVDYFMEINFRNDGNSICVTAAGVNLPYIWYQYNTNQSLKEEVNKQVKEVIVMPEFDDFENVKSRKITPWQWVKDICKTDRFMEFDKNDQKPFWIQLKKIFAKKVTRIWR